MGEKERGVAESSEGFSGLRSEEEGTVFRVFIWAEVEQCRV